MTVEASMYLRFLYHKKGLRGIQLKKALQREGFPEVSNRSIRRHAKLPLFNKHEDRRHFNAGRPKKLTPRDATVLQDSLLNLREGGADFSSVDIQVHAQIDPKVVGNRTLRRALNRLGYQYLQCRKKGLLTPEDLLKRCKFAEQYVNVPESFWTTDLSFYLDATSWIYKKDPSYQAVTSRTRTWRKPNEGLSINCTAKASKTGVNGRAAHFMVAISHGVGIIGAIHFESNMNGKVFADMIEAEFPTLFNKVKNNKRCMFLQDGDPSQNSARARTVMESHGYWVFPIPARSPDLNPIENIFHLVGQQIKKDGLNIPSENYDQFVARCQRTLLSFSIDTINKTIESMPRRIKLVIDNGGQRTKY